MVFQHQFEEVVPFFRDPDEIPVNRSFKQSYRAAFPFAFLQDAAHVVGWDFVGCFQQWLQLPEAKDYFPFLELRNEHILYVCANLQRQLENNAGTGDLMKYLNSGVSVPDHQERKNAARFDHWAQNSEAHRKLQVGTAVALFQCNMRDHATRFNLDGWPDHVCHAICDIFHQEGQPTAL